MYQPPKSGGWFLRVQDPIAENFIIADGYWFLAAGVAGVALDGVDDAVFAFFHNADVIGLPSCGPDAPFGRSSRKKTIMPGEGSTVLSAHCPRSAEPFNAADAPGKFRGGSRYQDNRTR